MEQLGMSQIGRYSVDKVLARGGMAEVYLGSMKGPGGFAKRVVLKKMLPKVAEDPSLVQMFLNEARLAAVLNHPNIVQVFDFGEENGQYYLAMEHIEGESVRSILNYLKGQGRRLPPRLVAVLALGVCEGLRYAHGLCDDSGRNYNIIHRDITPENILVTRRGMPKIVDFGIAKALTNSQQTEAGQLKGKYGYMPPEQIRGEPVNQQLDIYTLGVSLYELLAGSRPYVAETELALLQMILSGPAAPLHHKLEPDIPRRLAEIVEKAMAWNRAERYPDARALQDDLEDFLGTAGQRAAVEDLSSLVEEAYQFRRGPTSPSIAPTDLQPETKALGPPASVRGAWRRRAFASVLGAAFLGGVAGLMLHHSPEHLQASIPAATAQPPNPAGAKLTASAEATAAAPRQPTAAQAGAASAGGTSASSVPQALAGMTATTNAAGPGAGGAATASKPAPLLASQAQPPVAPAPTETTTKPGEEPNARTSHRRGDPAHHRRGAAAAVMGGEGYLTVRSSPWCDVFVDGQKVGVTPLVRASLPSGKHNLLLRNDEAGAVRMMTVEIHPGAEHKEAVLFPAP